VGTVGMIGTAGTEVGAGTGVGAEYVVKVEGSSSSSQSSHAAGAEPGGFVLAPIGVGAGVGVGPDGFFTKFLLPPKPLPPPCGGLGFIVGGMVELVEGTEGGADGGATKEAVGARGELSSPNRSSTFMAIGRSF